MIPAVLTFLAETPPPQGGGMGMLLMPILLIVLFYFMLIRPQRRQQQEHQLKIAALRTGDECVAAGGIHGLVTNVSDRTITLRIADNVKIRVEKNSVISITKKTDEPDADDKPALPEPDAAAGNEPKS